MAKRKRRMGGSGGILIVAGVGLYIALLVGQARAAAQLCENYPVGSPVNDMDELKGTYMLSAMGSMDFVDQNG